jgi:general stress protein YciG
MDRERQREIASQGGRAAHASGNAHQFTSEEARLAGSKRHQNAAARQAAEAASRNENG